MVKRRFVETMIKLVTPQIECTDDIWDFRQEIFDFYANNEDKFAGCMSVDSIKLNYRRKLYNEKILD